ncbi:MAG: phytanoyl-CoA dioxygenase family protein, partial [Planctomycetota bacterium]
MSSDMEFKAVPEEDDLAGMERDLRFYPSPVTDPGTMTVGQVQHYNQQGYVTPVDVFANDEITSIRSYFDELLEKTIAAGGDSYSISTAHLKHGRVYDLLT